MIWWLEIIRELTASQKVDEVPSKQVLVWSRRVQAQGAPKNINWGQKKSKDFDAVKNGQRTKAGGREMGVNFKYCGSKHEPQSCPAYGRSCSRCGKLNHFEWVCRGLRADRFQRITKDAEQLTTHA